MEGTIIEFDPTMGVDTVLIVNWLVAILLPLVTGLVTNRLTSSLVKHLVLASLNVLTAIGAGFVRAAESGTHFSLAGAIFTFITSMIVAWLTYDKIWKATGAARRAQEVGMKPDKILEADAREGLKK